MGHDCNAAHSLTPLSQEGGGRSVTCDVGSEGRWAVTVSESIGADTLQLASIPEIGRGRVAFFLARHYSFQRGIVPLKLASAR